MLYVSGRYALNLECSLGTPGDWHACCLDWNHIPLQDSEKRFFGSYGLELHEDVPGLNGPQYVANHIRACLDCLEDGSFGVTSDMRRGYLCIDTWTQEVLAKVWEMRELTNWREIDAFMNREYQLDWLLWKEAHGVFPEASYVPWSEDEKTAHASVIRDFLTFLNRRTHAFILKGGTALAWGYGLDRFTDDIELDAELQEPQSIIPMVQEFCALRRYECTVTKDLRSDKQCEIRYCADCRHPLKVEASYKDPDIDPDDVCIVESVALYDIQTLVLPLVMRRDRLRDLYDLCFIGISHRDKLGRRRRIIGDCLFYRGSDYLGYLEKLDPDPLVDTGRLRRRFLELRSYLGLLPE